jgi:hypothetical protein
MTCPKCNEPVDEAMQFCMTCGTIVTGLPVKPRPLRLALRIMGKLFPWGCGSALLVLFLLGILSNLIPTPAPVFTGVLTRGRDLQRSIIQANKMRASLGLPAIWPKTDLKTTNEAKDISGKSFKTSTEYFKALFDEENFGTAKWRPYVIDFQYSKLAGAGIQACTNNQLTAANNVWIIAANITDQDNDRIPFLVTRNVDVKEIERVVNQGLKKSEFKNRMIFSDIHKAPFSNKGFAVVRKGGEKSKGFSYDATLGELFDNKELPPRDPSKPKIVYLIP